MKKTIAMAMTGLSIVFGSCGGNKPQDTASQNDDFTYEVDAFAEEQKLISQYISEGAALVNQTEGGAGPYGYKQHPRTRALKSARAAGYKHKLITCPHCGFTGGATATRRWHFDNCKHKT